MAVHTQDADACRIERCSGPQPNCSNSSWECAAGYVEHASGQQCCGTATTYVPYEAQELTDAGRGGWVDGKCAWECSEGFHPKQPRREWYGQSMDCLPCDQYLNRLGVNCSTCIGKKIKPDAEHCWAAAQAQYQLYAQVCPRCSGLQRVEGLRVQG